MAIPFVAWWTWGESYLCLTQREVADILVVEGWVGPETLDAAATEFSIGCYRWIVAAGGPTGERWNRQRWTHAEIAKDGLVAAGVSLDKIICAPARDVETQRTYESALAVQQNLAVRGLRPAAINVFTRGAHARRSQLVYANVFGPNTRVGIISWLPTGMPRNEDWWHSTTRAKDLLTETIGCLYEALFNSGRARNASAVAIPLPGPLAPSTAP